MMISFSDNTLPISLLLSKALLIAKVISESAFNIKSALNTKSAFRYHFWMQKCKIAGLVPLPIVVDINFFSIGEKDYAWWYDHHPWPPPPWFWIWSSKRMLRASLIPSQFSLLVVAGRVDREVYIAGHCRSCCGCGRSRRRAAILFLTRSIRITLRYTRW